MTAMIRSVGTCVLPDTDTETTVGTDCAGGDACARTLTGDTAPATMATTVSTTRWLRTRRRRENIDKRILRGLGLRR
jgi:hypothetical protein